MLWKPFSAGGGGNSVSCYVTLRMWGILQKLNRADYEKRSVVSEGVAKAADEALYTTFVDGEVSAGMICLFRAVPQSRRSQIKHISERRN